MREVSRVQSEVDSVAQNFENEIEQNAVACHLTENSLRVKSIYLFFDGHEILFVSV